MKGKSSDDMSSQQLSLQSNYKNQFAGLRVKNTLAKTLHFLDYSCYLPLLIYKLPDTGFINNFFDIRFSFTHTVSFILAQSLKLVQLMNEC